jgi:ribose/xylose/arabinose/galactoside ABC-type transport system permease subunit
MQAYFEDHNARPFGAIITNVLIAILGLGSLITAHQVLTGWFAIGARANVSRHDLSMTEWVIALGAILMGVAALRTAWGVYRREPAGWAWTQWVSFVSIFLGVGVGMSTILSSTQEGSELQPTLVILGVILFVLYSWVYRYSTRGADMPPEEYFRIQLAESPSAGAIMGFAVVFIGFSMTTSLFLEPTSIASILTNNASRGIIAIGITILMISGEFDLSVGSVVGTTAMFFMIGMTEGYLGFIDPQPPLVAGIAALVYAACLGLINGMIFTLTGIPSFIVTLGTLFAYRAITLVTIGGGRILRYKDYYDEFPQVFVNRWILIGLAVLALLAVLYVAYRVVPQNWRNVREKWATRHDNGYFGTTSALVRSFTFVALVVVLALIVLWLVLVVVYHADNLDTSLQVGAFDIANGRWAFTLEQVTDPIRPVLEPIEDALGISFILSIPPAANFRMAIVWWLILVVVFQIILVRTRYGNAVFAVGGNIGAAIAQGVNASRVKVQNFVLCSFLAGVAAILEVTRNPGVDPLRGEGWELEVIAMTVIGGALLTGGYGSIIGTMLGVFIFGMMRTGLVLVGMDERAFEGVVGVIMIFAVVANNMTKRRR